MCAFKSSCVKHGIKKAMHMPKTIHILRKGLIFREYPKLSPLADLQALHKQKIKVKAVLQMAWLSIERSVPTQRQSSRWESFKNPF